MIYFTIELEISYFRNHNVTNYNEEKKKMKTNIVQHDKQQYEDERINDEDIIIIFI